MKNFFKRAVAILLACFMTVALVACAKSGESKTEDSKASTETEETTQKEETAKSGDYVKLVLWAVGNADTADCAEVAEAVNKIAREKIGCEIELVRGQDGEQINLALTTGEPIDLLCYNNINGQFNTVVNNNWAYPLDDLLEKYGQGAKEVINPYDLDACKYNGVLYALPNQKDTSRAAGFAMRKDICDALGITVPEEGTYEEMHEILVKVHEAYPDMYPLGRRWNADHPAERSAG